MGPFTTLQQQAWHEFLAVCMPRFPELFALPVEDALCEIADELGSACDAVLDEKKLGFSAYNSLLLTCCMEDMRLFTESPQACECLEQQGDYNGAHAVYHMVYDTLHSCLEQEFEEYHTRATDE